MKRKTVWGYIDGKKTADIVALALKHNLMLSQAKQLFIAENQGHEVTFKVEES